MPPDLSFIVLEESLEILILETCLWTDNISQLKEIELINPYLCRTPGATEYTNYTSLDRRYCCQLDNIEKKRKTFGFLWIWGFTLCGQTLRGRYRGRIVWAGTVIWNKREYRDVFYANQALPRPTRESTVSPQNCRFLETKTKSCLFCFQSGLGPPSLPFQSKIGCRRHLVVSRQERGHKMMLNCFSKEFYKVVMMIMQNGILRRLVESLECKMVSGVTCTGRHWETHC